MRKLIIFFVLAAALLLPAAMWGQNTGLTSLQNDFSFGVFWNELDKAVNVGSGFSTLSNNFLFGGIANLNKNTTIASFPSTTAPIWLGLYRTGPTPWSLFGGFHMAGLAAAGNSSQTTYTTLNTETVVSGTTTTDYYWYTQITDEKQSVPLYSAIDDAAQFLIDLGAFNLGAYFRVALNNNTVPANNRTITDTFQYRTSAANTAPVTTAVDYTVTDKATDRTGIDNTLELGVPIYLKALQATANLQVRYHWTDASTTSNVSYTVPANSGTIPPFAAGTFQNTQNDVTSRTSEIPIDLSLKKDFAPLFGSHPDNRLTLGAGVNATLMGATESTLDILQPYTYVVAGASTLAAGGTNDTVDQTFSPTLAFGAEVTASHSLYFDLGSDVHFGVIPGVQVSYSSTPTDVRLASETTVNRIDGDGDGAFTTAADTVNTTTIAYSNTMRGGVDESVDNDILVSLTLPTGFMFQIAPWFGFTLGAQPRLEATWTFSKTTASTDRTTVILADGAGTVTSTTVNSTAAAPGTATNSFGPAYTVAVDSNLGVRIGIPGNAMLYIDVSGAFAGIWTFAALAVQGVIPL